MIQHRKRGGDRPRYPRLKREMRPVDRQAGDIDPSRSDPEVVHPPLLHRDLHAIPIDRDRPLRVRHRRKRLEIVYGRTVEAERHVDALDPGAGWGEGSDESGVDIADIALVQVGGQPAPRTLGDSLGPVPPERRHRHPFEPGASPETGRLADPRDLAGDRQRRQAEVDIEPVDGDRAVGAAVTAVERQRPDVVAMAVERRGAQRSRSAPDGETCLPKPAVGIGRRLQTTLER